MEITIEVGIATPETMTAQPLAFDMWKTRLREDCERNDKLMAYTSLGEECLKILWEYGTEPSVRGVIVGGKQKG